MQNASVSKKSQTTETFKDNESVSLNKTLAGRKLQVAEILEKLGEFGRFHYKTLIVCILASIAISTSNAALPFLMKEPTFMCKDQDGNLYECNQEKACVNPTGYQLDYSIHSLVIEHRLYCDRRWIREWGQSLLFILSSFLATFAMFSLERFGRRFIFNVVAVGTLACNILLFFFSNFWIIIIILTFLWAFAYLYFTNFYVYSTEVFNGKWRSVANSTFFVFNYSTKIIYILLNLMISTFYGNYILMTVLGVLFLPLVYFLLETPYYYHRKGDVHALKLNLQYINKNNNFRQPELVAENDKMIAHSLHIENLNEEELHNVSAMEINRKTQKSIFNEEFTRKSYIIHMSLIIIAVIPNFIGGQLGENIPYKLGINNIFISSVLFVTIIIIANFILMFYLHKIPRKKGNIIVVLILISFSVIFVLFAVLGIQHKKSIKLIGLVITLLSTGLGMAQFLLISRYVNEVFPTKIRANSIAFVLQIGRMSMFLVNVIDPLSEKVDVHPFAFLGVLYICSLPCFWRFEETLNKPTKN